MTPFVVQPLVVHVGQLVLFCGATRCSLPVPGQAPGAAPDDGQGPAPELKDLLKQASGDASTLLRQEAKLAQTEMTQKAKQLGVGAGLVGGASYVLVLAMSR